ncbi:N-acetyltransferase ESCO2 [Coccinella septempunctata]|uniref:N-acetyltransferase ESCO2 n=1 Tax=Coccinella septempunctata TaxID=41139 RepID=UPI001D070D90|nr:N-acetyltransferase ESCO2 [Coccinella septempunctata]
MEEDANLLDASPEYIAYQNISKIPSTELIRKILDTPEKKLNFEVSTTSPCRNIEDNGNTSSLSLTQILKTPNDSHTHTEEAPKIPRKSIGSDKEDQNSSCNKSSKVRTTLFRDMEISLSTRQFYPSTDPIVSKKKTSVLSIHSKKLDDQSKRRKSLPRKRLFGQINGGVRHKIRKREKSPKISKASVSQIKTYKSDFAVDSKFEEYMKDLKEISQNKEVKLIQHVPKVNLSNTLKKSHDDTTDIVCEKSKNSETVLNDPTSNFSFENDTLENEVSVPIENILNALEESVGEDKENRCRDKEGLLSPTAELSTMTLGLKLGSPKTARNLTTVFQNMADTNSQASLENNKSEYYPLFYPQKRKMEKALEKECPIKRRKMKVTSDQMLLDAGQKKFGLVECAECNYVYNAGDPKDEHLHDNHHNATNILQFNGWKNERIVDQIDGRIIQILPGDSKQWIDKVKRLASFINREMGYQNMEIDISRSMVFLFIFNKSIIGCLMAESKTSANKILTANVEVDLCSLEEYPVTCGVSRIWVAPSYRKKGIATKLMETLRKNFLPDRMVEKGEIALSAPTPDGKLFATKYFQTPNFYTYLN